MLLCAKLLLVVILAFSPLVEFFDNWEQPWSGNSSGETVFTVISCAIALGYAAVRRLIPSVRNLVRRHVNPDDASTSLVVRTVLQHPAIHRGRASPFPLSPLRI